MTMAANVDGTRIKQEYDIALSRYLQHSLEKTNQDQQKPWNWKYAVQELMSPYSWFENKEWSYFYTTIPELEQFVSELATKIFSSTENGYRSFTGGDDNPAIDFLLNGGNDGMTIADALSKIDNPELRQKTLAQITSCILDSDVVRQFDAMMLDKALNNEIETTLESKLHLKYKAAYDKIKDKHNSSEDEHKMREYEHLSHDERFNVKSAVSAQDGKGVVVSAEEVLKLRRIMIERIFKEEQGLPFFQNMLKQRQLIIDQAESLLFRPETNIGQVLRDALFRALALGDAVLISDYDKTANVMNVFLAANDTVHWLCDKSGRITDIFIRYRMTVAQAKDFFTDDEFNNILSAFSVGYNQNEESQNLTKYVFLIQKIAVSFDRQKPHDTTWIADIDGKDGGYAIIRQGSMYELPVHILRIGIDYATGRGKSLVLNVLRQVRNLYALEKSRMVALVTAMNPSVAFSQSVENAIGSIDLLKPNKKIILPDQIMQLKLSERLDPQESEKMLQIAREEEQFIVARIGKYLNSDVLDQFTTEDLHASVGSQTVILASQRALQKVSRFYDIFEPLFVQIADFFLKSVASRYDNPAIPIKDNLSAWITVRIIGISEKATKDLQSQESFDTYNKIMQSAAAMANFDPEKARCMLDVVDEQALVKSMFYKNPKLQVDDKTVALRQKQRADQQAQQQQMAMLQAQSQSAVAGAQVGKMNADANLSSARVQQIQTNPRGA